MAEIFRFPGMGYRRDRYDPRDYRLYTAQPDISRLPIEGDLPKLFPDAFDQRDVGSCTGWSAGQTARGVMMVSGHPEPFMPSPVFLYQEARRYEYNVTEDAGAQIRDVWKAMSKLGMPSIDDLAPAYGPKHDPNPKTWLFPTTSVWRKKPGKLVYTKAGTRQMLRFYRLDTLEEVLACLGEGYPVNFGFDVYRSFYGDRGPRLHIPEPMTEKGDYVLGGHAVSARGWNMREQWIKTQNQWGKVAHEGNPFFYLSFNTIRKYASDMWTGRLVEYEGEAAMPVAA